MRSLSSPTHDAQPNPGQSGAINIPGPVPEKPLPQVDVKLLPFVDDPKKKA